DGPFELFPGAAGARGDLLQAAGVVRDGVLVGGDQQVLLGFDVVVKAGFPQAHRGGDVLHGRRSVALLAEQAQRGFQELFVPARPAHRQATPGGAPRVCPSSCSSTDRLVGARSVYEKSKGLSTDGTNYSL